MQVVVVIENHPVEGLVTKRLLLRNPGFRLRLEASGTVDRQALAAPLRMQLIVELFHPGSVQTVDCLKEAYPPNFSCFEASG